MPDHTTLKHRGWTRDECILVLDLYCRTPFGKLHAGNPDVADLAALLNRTAGAVAMKAVNFASLDPEQQRRGVSGLKNASRLDRQIFAEFLAVGHWLDFLEEVEAARYRVDTLRNLTNAAHQAPLEPAPNETETWRQSKVRLVQSFFRKTVLSSYDMCCAFCRLNDVRLLAASHIIPWADDETRRADPTNGLSLCALHDRAFDRGLMCIDDDLRIRVSKELLHDVQAVELCRVAFAEINGQRMNVPYRFTPDPAALAYHRIHRYEAK